MALEDHLLLPRDQMCDVHTPPFPTNPEDGITEWVTGILAARNVTEEAGTWEGIWRLLFPGDLEVPDSGTVPPASTSTTISIY